MTIPTRCLLCQRPLPPPTLWQRITGNYPIMCRMLPTRTRGSVVACYNAFRAQMGLGPIPDDMIPRDL